MVNIREAEKKDLKEISEIFRTESSKKPYKEKWTPKTVLKKVNEFFEKQDIHLAIVEGEIVGFIVSNINLDDNKKAYIEELWLKPKYRGKGIGKSLVKIVENKYKNKGVKAIRLVSSKKSKAFEFYKKLKYNEKTDLVFMERRI